MNDETPPRRAAGDFLRVRHLRLLELVDRGGSLAAAARELHLSQPAVTKMLQELEAAFGAPLVARAARGGSLTPEGRVALQRLQLGLSQFDAAIATARSGRAKVPMLRVGVLPLVSVSLLPATMQALARRGDDLRLVVKDATAAGLLQLLATGGVDCAIGRAEPDALPSLNGACLVQLPLADERLVFACAPAHALARKRRIGLVQLQEQRWVLPGPGTHTRRLFDALFLDHGMQPPEPVVESASFHANLQLLHAANALTVAPRSAVGLYLGMGLAQPLRNAPALSAGPLSLMYLAQQQEFAALRLFERAAREAGAAIHGAP